MPRIPSSSLHGKRLTSRLSLRVLSQPAEASFFRGRFTCPMLCRASRKRELSALAPSLPTAYVSRPVTSDSRRAGQTRSNLRYSVGDGAAFGVMVGAGETYLPAFALAVGLGDLVSGLIGSLPLLFGGVLQLISPRAIRLLGSHKRWVVFCGLVQALMFLPLIAAALCGSISAPLVLLVASIYWGASLATGPAWNTWIGTLVPPRVRARYFASRTRISQSCVFCGFLAAGVALQFASGSDTVLVTHAVLFAIAGACRLVSVFMLASHSEPIPIPPRMKREPYYKLFLKLTHGKGGRLLLFLVMVQAAVQMAGPYFTPFMFNTLELDYAQFVILIALCFLFRIAALPAWGKLAERVGAMRLLWIGALGIAPVGFGWVISHNFYWLMAIQAFSGAAWAAYELAFFLMFFDSIKEEERTGMLTVYNLVNSAAWVAGAMLGGLILVLSDTSMFGYLLIFGLSSLGRVAALALLARVPKTDVEATEIGFRTTALRPTGANLNAPVLPSLPDQVPDLAVQAS